MRLEISLPSWRLLPVAIQRQELGTETVSDLPSRRSDQFREVRAAARTPDSSVWVTLSMRTTGEPLRRTDVICLRRSSSLRGSDMAAGAAPVVMMPIDSTRRVLPEPGGRGVDGEERDGAVDAVSDYLG